MLEEHDRTGAPVAAVVNESFVRKFLPNEDPIGKHANAWFANALSCGIPLPSHQGFSWDCAADTVGRNAGAAAAAARPLKRARLERLDLPTITPMEEIPFRFRILPQLNRCRLYGLRRKSTMSEKHKHSMNRRNVVKLSHAMPAGGLA